MNSTQIPDLGTSDSGAARRSRGSGPTAAFCDLRSISVSIIDNDAEAQAGLAQMLDSAPGYRCLSQHASAETALRDIPRLCPDVAIITINLPGLNGIECASRLKSLLPSLQVVMLTVSLEIGPILNALSGGASGCLLKQTPPWELLYAIREVHQGGSPMNGQIARKIVEFIQKPPPPAPGAANLTSRQAQVLDLLAQGCSYREIARLTQLTYATVHTHIRHLYKKLQVRSRSQAVARHSWQRRRLDAIESVAKLADRALPQTKPEWPIGAVDALL